MTQGDVIERLLVMRWVLDLLRKLSLELHDTPGIPAIEKKRLRVLVDTLEPSDTLLAQMERRSMRPGWFTEQEESRRVDPS